MVPKTGSCARSGHDGGRKRSGVKRERGTTEETASKWRPLPGTPPLEVPPSGSLRLPLARTLQEATLPSRSFTRASTATRAKSVSLTASMLVLCY